MNVSDLIRSRAFEVPAQCGLEGVFVLARGRAYLVPSLELKDDERQSISLDYEILKPLLLARVPAWGGGSYLYCDPASVEGLVSSSSESGGAPFHLTEVTSFTLERRGKAFQVVP